MIDERRNEVIHNNWNLQIYLIYLKNGIVMILDSKNRQMITVLFFTIQIILFSSVLMLTVPENTFLNLNELANKLKDVLSICCIVFVSLYYLYLNGKPFWAKRANRNLKRAGFVNHTGESPLLLSKRKLKENNRVLVYKFHTLGIPYKHWEDNLQQLESALNVRIDHFEQGNNSREVIMYAVDGNYNFPKMLPWKKEYLIPNSQGFILTLGERITSEKVTINLSTEYPHLMLAGATGSGKTVLLRLLSMQCVEKNANVIICDMKGGIDFPSVWHEKCEIIFDKNELICKLESVVEEHNHRKQLLSKLGTPNIEEYNKIASKDKQLNHIIIAMDEFSDILDKTALSKEDKCIVNKIESLLSVIARQGRATGINLFLSTQRPSADLLIGAIRSNILYRVCGRADRILAQIVLDSSEAAERVAKNATGRFVDNNNTLFQAYYFNDKEW